MSEYCVIGRRGFIGGALARRLGNVTPFPTADTRVLFHFGSHTHPKFEENPEFEMKQLIDSFSTLLPYCRDRGILFVYPSSALVYEKETTFSRFKKTLESLVGCYKTRSIGLRIFPVYGPNDNGTVISQWCASMAIGEQPLVYGNGEQARDFIYIDDAVDQILSVTDEKRWGQNIVNIGTGVSTTFNEIVALINAELGTNIQPRYVNAPAGYSAGIVTTSPLPSKISVKQGVRNILSAQLIEWKNGTPNSYMVFRP